MDTGTVMRPDAVFWLLSMTKAITATACMKVVEQGRLKLDHDASEYLPQIAAPKVLVGLIPTDSRSCIRLGIQSRFITF